MPRKILCLAGWEHGRAIPLATYAPQQTVALPALQLTFDGFRVAVFAFKEASDAYRPEGNLSRYGIASPSHDGFRQIPYGRTSQDSQSLSRWCRAGWRISCDASFRARHIPLAVVPVPNLGAPGLQRCCR